MTTPDPIPAKSRAPGRLPQLEKYELVEEIGHGGMATVYRAHDPRLGRDVAVKIIHPHLRESKEVAHRFAVEAQAVAKLRHPNIVEVFDVSDATDPEQYLVTELLHGRTLRSVLRDRGKLPPEVAAALGIELCAALAHAHEQGIVHRDVKPENVFLEHPALAASSAPSSGRARVKVKLMDFGIAKLLDAQGVTSTGQVLGSPAHMAPEQIEGGEVDGRSDVFPLGVLLYECMVGHLPFEGANPAQVLRRVLDGVYPQAEHEEPRVGRRWSALLDRALARDREGRFASVALMKDALDAELARVGALEPLAELDAWCGDPGGYESAHDARMVKKLTELGNAARKRKDALGAANDYNRALAYAPGDAALLRVVAGMQRSEARARLLRRAAPVVLVAAGVGAVAFFATRALKHARVDAAPSASAAKTAPVGSGSAEAAPSASVAATASVATIRVRPVRSAVPTPTTRSLTIVRVTPPQGVLLAIDDGAPSRVQTGDNLTVDTAHEHALVFTCALDLCVPERRTVAAGTKDEPVSVELRIRPAVLVVEGDSTKQYVIVEHPTLALQAGQPTNVPAQSGAAFDVNVKEVGSNAARTVTLRPGQTSTVSFR